MTNAETLMLSTIRLEATCLDGTESLGTGFLFAFITTATGFQKSVVVTNKHVIEDSISLKISFTREKASGIVDYGNKFTEVLSVSEKDWIPHPDKDVDLCVLPFIDIYEFLEKKHGKFAFLMMRRDLIATQEKLDSLRPIEDIIMIGYPTGLWDDVNNMPIVRRGITATHPKLDYQGRKEILIDAACFPGSSGSPVLIFNEGGYISKEGNFIVATRIILLGILYGGDQHTIEGKAIKKPISTLVDIPMNLGNIIKSELLLDLEGLVP